MGLLFSFTMNKFKRQHGLFWDTVQHNPRTFRLCFTLLAECEVLVCLLQKHHQSGLNGITIIVLLLLFNSYFERPTQITIFFSLPARNNECAELNMMLGAIIRFLLAAQLITSTLWIQTDYYTMFLLRWARCRGNLELESGEYLVLLQGYEEGETGLGWIVRKGAMKKSIHRGEN